MDNKITRRRLYNLMSYEWVAIIVFILVAIFTWEILYGIFGVKLTVGQQYKYFYDINVSDQTDLDFVVFLEDKKVFSYDLVKIEAESLFAENDLLTTRLSSQEGDAIFTDIDKDDKTNEIRANSLIDNENVLVCDFEKLLKDARIYLSGYLKDQFSALSDEEKLEKTKDVSNISEEKILQGFNNRLGKDNRYRTQELKAEGFNLEKERIYKLVKDANDFEYLLSVGDELDLFHRYTRYSQSLSLAKEDYAKERYQGLYDRQVQNGKENLIYALKLENLKGGEKNTSEVFKLDKENVATSESVVLMVFDFVYYQQDLQFESISLINAIVENCSDVYKGR